MHISDKLSIFFSKHSGIIQNIVTITIVNVLKLKMKEQIISSEKSCEYSNLFQFRLN